MCSRCADLELRIIELEEELGQRLSMPRLIHDKLNTTASQAYLLAALYRTKRWMKRLELDQEIPRVFNGANRLDRELRTLNGVAVLVWQTKGRLGQGIIESRAGTMGGYRLSEKGRALVAAVLA